MEPVIGTLLGGLFRLAPEIMGQLDRKNERKHELDMLRAQMDADKLRAEWRAQEASAAYNATIDAEFVAAYRDAVRGQSQITGIGWVDALSQTVRPILTYWWCMVLVSVAMSARFYLALTGGLPLAEAFLSIWGVWEQSLVSTIMSFWFLDRVLKRT